MYGPETVVNMEQDLPLQFRRQTSLHKRLLEHAAVGLRTVLEEDDPLLVATRNL